MFQRNVQLSEDMFIAGSPIFYISRALGLAPFKISFSDTIVVRLSRLYTTISCCACIIAVILTTYGCVEDLGRGGDALKMKSTQSSVIAFADVLTVNAIVCLGVLGAPRRAKHLFRILLLLNEMDKVLCVKDSAKVRRNQMIILTTTVVSISCLLLVNICVESDKGAANYALFYILYVIVFVLECQYWLLLNSIARRFAKLNEGLKYKHPTSTKTQRNAAKLFTIKTEREISRVTPDSNADCFFKELIRNVRQGDRTGVIVVDSSTWTLYDNIMTLNATYCQLFEAVDIINEGFGLLILVMIISCLFSLVTTPYFLLLDLLAETTSSSTELALQFLWVVAHTCRLIMIIEPCHSVYKQVSNVYPLVSRLFNSDIEDYYKKQLQIFCLQSSHLQIEFSAYGLCSINRPLLSAIAGAITTYLVILLQFR